MRICSQEPGSLVGKERENTSKGKSSTPSHDQADKWHAVDRGIDEDADDGVGGWASAALPSVSAIQSMREEALSSE